MTREEKIICKEFLNDADKSHSCNEYKLLMALLEQEPKTGHWIYICNSEVNWLKVVECSECGKRTYGSGKYCPNCGAKMIEPQESEEEE